MIEKLMFRLLPVQIILAAVGTVNMIVSSYFASNYVGTEAMSAVGLYGPLNMFFGAVATMLVGGSSKDHSVDVRVVCKGDEVILRIKDDCVPFDPVERSRLTEGSDAASNIGIRMVYSIANNIKYQNLFGLNVLTIRI